MEKRGKISGWKKVVRFLAFWLIFLALLAGTMFVLNKHHEKESPIRTLVTFGYERFDN